MVARSTDGGLTWPTPAVYAQPGPGRLRQRVDRRRYQPFQPLLSPRLYVTWTNFAAGPDFIEKWSSDNGVTWNPPRQQLCHRQLRLLRRRPVLHARGAAQRQRARHLEHFGGQIAVGKSTDGGQSFINPNTVGGASVISQTHVPGSNWRLNTIPSTAASPATGTARLGVGRRA